MQIQKKLSSVLVLSSVILTAALSMGVSSCNSACTNAKQIRTMIQETQSLLPQVFTKCKDGFCKVVGSEEKEYVGFVQCSYRHDTYSNKGKGDLSNLKLQNIKINETIQYIESVVGYTLESGSYPVPTNAQQGKLFNALWKFRSSLISLYWNIEGICKLERDWKATWTANNLGMTYFTDNGAIKIFQKTYEGIEIEARQEDQQKLVDIVKSYNKTKKVIVGTDGVEDTGDKVMAQVCSPSDLD